MFNAKIKQNPEEHLEFVLYFEDLDQKKAPRLRVRLVDARKFFMPLYGPVVDLPLVFSDPLGMDAWVRVPLARILNQCGATNLNSRVLEFQLLYDGMEEFVSCGESFQPIEVEDKLLTYKLCQGSGGNLVLRLVWKEHLIECEMVPEKDEFVVDLNAKQPGQLVLRHRIEHDIVWYDGETAYEVQPPYQCRIPYQDLMERMSADNDMFSLFYLVSARNDAPAYYYRVVTEQDASRCKKGDYQFTACKIKNGTASLECRRSRQQAVISATELTDDGVTLRFAGQAGGAVKLRRVISFPGSRDGGERKFAQENALVFEDTHVTVDHWGHLHQRHPLLFQMILETPEGECWVVAGEPMEHVWELEHQTVTLIASPKGAFLRVVERGNRIRLGILGTCMTRWAFSRKYTDAYRSLYEVPFAHFWPSAFSLTEEPIDFPAEQYAEYTDQEDLCVRREYGKTSMKELAEADCEYVLLDFFVDAIHGPRRMKDGKFIGYKAYGKDFYQDFLMFDTEKFYIDSNGYFEAWKKAADRMMEELTKIFPQNRIVLATGGLTHYYLSEEGKIECFDGKTLRGSAMTKHSINSLNYLWDRMNAYFIEKLPGAQVLNMRQYNCLAHDNNPANVRPYHYVNEYYRIMSAELSRIVLWDRQNP